MNVSTGVQVIKITTESPCRCGAPAKAAIIGLTKDKHLCSECLEYCSINHLRLALDGERIVDGVTTIVVDSGAEITVYDPSVPSSLPGVHVWNNS